MHCTAPLLLLTWVGLTWSRPAAEDRQHGDVYRLSQWINPLRNRRTQLGLQNNHFLHNFLLERDRFSVSQQDQEIDSQSPVTDINHSAFHRQDVPRPHPKQERQLPGNASNHDAITGVQPPPPMYGTSGVRRGTSHKMTPKHRLLTVNKGPKSSPCSSLGLCKDSLYQAQEPTDRVAQIIQKVPQMPEGNQADRFPARHPNLNAGRPKGAALLFTGREYPFEQSKTSRPPRHKHSGFPSHEKFTNAQEPEETDNVVNSARSSTIRAHLNPWKINPEQNPNLTSHKPGSARGNYKQWLQILLSELGDGRRDKRRVLVGKGGSHQTPFTNQEMPSRQEEAEEGQSPSSMRLMNVILTHNSDQLRSKSSPPEAAFRENPGTGSSFIIRSNTPFLRRAKPATSADWVAAEKLLDQQKATIDQSREFKTNANVLSKSGRAKRDVGGQKEAEAANPDSSDDSNIRPSSNSLETSTAVRAQADNYALGEDQGTENASLSDTKLSYRFRGMVGLVDDSRLPIKHFDNTEDLSQQDLGRQNPEIISKLPYSNDTNDYAGPLHIAGGNHSYFVPISDPINATKPVGQQGTPQDKTSPTPSLNSDTNYDGWGLISPAPQPETSFPEPETVPEPEDETQADVDNGVDPESEPESETEPEPEAEGSDPEMEPESENTDSPGYDEGYSQDNDNGEYLGHVDVDTSNGESEPEVEPTSEPEGEGSGDPCVKECYAEPAPEWNIAKDTWRSAWEIHVYGLGTVFAVLGLYSMISIIRLGHQRNLLSQGYFISLNAMLLVLCISRASMLLIDGYNSGGTFHPVVAYLLYSVGLPCLTSAFSILFLALLKTMKMQLLSPKIQKPQVLLGIIIVHFTISLTVDMILGYFYDGRITSMVCQVISLLWGASLSVGYMYVFRKLFVSAVKRQREMQRMSESLSKIGSQSTSDTTPKRPKLMVNIAIKVTLVTAILGFIMVCVHIYGMVDVMNVFTQNIPGPWPWWGLHFGLRLVEIGMCITMSYVATQPFRYQKAVPEKTKNTFMSQCLDVVYLVPCTRLCQMSSKSETEDFSHQLQMTAHQESLVQNNQNMGYSNVNLHHQDMDNTYEITETPALDDRKHIIDNKLFGAVSYEKEVENDGIDEAEGTNGRPTSMLIKEGGFIRFRQEWDPLGDPIGSTDDELNASSSMMLDNGYISTSNGECIRTDGDPGHYHRHFAKYYQPHRNGRLPQCDKEGNLPEPDQHQSISVPNTGANTPATPRSFCSTDAEVMSEVFNFRPPSSIHLRESIEGALDYSDLSLRSPDYFGTQESFPLPKTPEELDEGQDFPSEKPRKRKFSEADLPFGSRLKRGSSRASKRSCQSDLKTPDLPWAHKSPRQYWEKVKSKGSSVSLNLATPYSSGYSPLGDGGEEQQYTVADVRNYLMRSSLYRSNSDSLTHIKYENYEHGTDV